MLSEPVSPSSFFLRLDNSVLTHHHPLDQNSGLVEYQVAPGQSPQNLTQTVGPQGLGFPVQWNPRYTAAFGVAANVDHLEDFKVHNVTRIAAILKTNTSTYFANRTSPSSSILPTSYRVHR